MNARVVSAVVWSVVCVVVLAGLLLGFLFVRGGGPAPEWAAFARPGVLQTYGESDGPETALRALRLAGFPHVAVGGARDVVVRLDVPEVRVPSDVSLSWQAGFAAAASAYPKAGTITVQLFRGPAPLLQAAAPGAEVRAALEHDDPAALRKGMTLVYGAGAGTLSLPAAKSPSFWSYVRAGATGGVVRPPAEVSAQEREAALAFSAATAAGFAALPSDTLVTGVQVSTDALDTKNRAARLLGIRGVQGAAREFADRWNRARAEGQTWEPRMPQAVESGTPEGTAEDAVVQEVAKAKGVENAEPFVTAPPVDLKTGYLVARAVAVEDRRGSVLDLVGDLAGSVRTSPLSFRTPQLGPSYLR